MPVDGLAIVAPLSVSVLPLMATAALLPAASHRAPTAAVADRAGVLA